MRRLRPRPEGSGELPAASPEIRYVGRTETTGGSVSFDWAEPIFECRFTGGSLAVRVSDTKKELLQPDPRRTRCRHRRDIRHGFPRGAGRRTRRGRAHAANAETHRGRTGAHDAPRIPTRTERTAAPRTAIARTPHRVHRQLADLRLRDRRPFEGRTLRTRNRKLRQGVRLHRGPLLRRRLHAHRPLGTRSGATTATGTPCRRIRWPTVSATRSTSRPLPAWNFTASPYRPDIIVINLGSNDFSTEPHPSREEFAAAYTRILRTLRDAYGDTPRRYSAWPHGSGGAGLHLHPRHLPRGRRTEPALHGRAAGILQRRQRPGIVGAPQLHRAAQTGDAP